VRERFDLAVVGAGAAGLMAAIQAGRRAPGARIGLFDGARTLGAKILVSGGGRCNVTHACASERDYAGSTPPAIRKVLLRFGVADTVAFFRELGVELKREETGKLFPVTDDARTVLDALLRAAREAAVELRHPWRVVEVAPSEGGFELRGTGGSVAARRVILATGGKSLPKSGSDGAGLEIARALGHTVTPRLLPALVALTLADGCFLRSLAGVTLPATLEVRAATGRRLASFTDSTLLTHFGISGPSAMNASRHYLEAALGDPGASLVANWLPGETADSVDAALRDPKNPSPGRWLAARIPERLARALCEAAGVPYPGPVHALSRERRRALASLATSMRLPVTGHRGWNFAEATAGGVPLRELRLETMESRARPGLHLCGEMCDVDGRIGGFNFQWAWASGFVAGTGAARAIAGEGGGRG
jgi:predicted Rossmann fold flavoprotein